MCIRGYHETRRARAHISDAITTLGITKLLLYYFYEVYFYEV